MRKTILATAASALAATALVAGAGTASADEAEEPGTSEAPVCVVIETFAGNSRTMCLTPAVPDTLGGFGYGSFGTGSLADLLTGLINTGSVVLSVDVPNSTGSYAPGSQGSYGPEASIGHLLTGSIGVIAGSV